MRSNNFSSSKILNTLSKRIFNTKNYTSKLITINNYNITTKNKFTTTNNNNKILNYITSKSFAGCGNECGCHSNNKTNNNNNINDTDDKEKELKSLNYKIIQCINLGKYDDAIELSDEYIEKLKEHYGNNK
jgi:hypothetical protein